MQHSLKPGDLIWDGTSYAMVWQVLDCQHKMIVLPVLFRPDPHHRSDVIMQTPAPFRGGVIRCSQAYWIKVTSQPDRLGRVAFCTLQMVSKALRDEIALQQVEASPKISSNLPRFGSKGRRIGRAPSC